MIKTSLPALAALLISASTAFADVNIYSSRQPELIAPILENFTQETGIKTNIVFLKDGLIERLKAEGDKSPADLVLTVDIANLSAIAESGSIQPVNSDRLTSRIPAEYRDADGKWFGVTRRARIVYASKDRVGADDVTTYEDLADEKWRGRICTRSGTHNYNIALLSAVIAHHGAEAAENWLTQIKANLARKPQGNDRAQVKAIWAGECDIAIGNSYYMGKMLGNDEEKLWANSVKVVFAYFEDAGAHINLSGMAMTKSAPNREEALKLMEYLVSDRAQQLYAEINFEYPVVAGIAPSELVAGWGAFTPDNTPLSAIAAHRATALKIVERVGFDD